MKATFIILCILCAYCTSAQNIANKKWQVQSSSIVVNGDTAYLFKSNEQNNLYALSKISYQFNSSNIYMGTSVDGTAIAGQWALLGNQIQIDSVISGFQFIDSSTFAISAPFTIQDTLGNTALAISILKFYYSPTTDFALSVFPNPFNTELNVHIQSPTKFEARIELRNAIGQVVYSIPSKTYATETSLIIPLKYLPSGVYHFAIQSDNFVENRKIVKQ